MESILRKPVAVLGGGACAQMFAAEFSLAAYEVRLYELEEFAEHSLASVLRTREVKIEGEQRNFKWFKREGTATVDVVTTDISKAMKGAGLVVVSIPASGHKRFFEGMIPHLEDGQVVSIFPDNFGALMLRNMMDTSGCRADVLIGGWSSMPYGVRLIEPGHLNCSLRIRNIIGAALPATRSKDFVELWLKTPAFDGVIEAIKGDTILSADLSNPNPVIHVPGSILNVGAMEVSETEGIFGIPKGQYSMYKHGMCPAVSRVQLAFYREEVKIAEALGIEIAKHTEEQFFWKGSIMGFEYWVPFVDVVMPPIKGPDTVDHRYFTEDIPVGTYVRHQLAEKLGVDAPVIRSLFNLGSVICKRDFAKEGVTLKSLGIEDLSRDELVRYLREGEIEKGANAQPPTVA